jgi:hypothetical protein
MMKRQLREWTLGLAGCVLFTLVASAQPAEPPEPKLPPPAECKALSVTPAKVTLRGGDDAQQLAITALLQNGRAQDLSGGVQYEVANAKLARVTAAGRVIPLADGSTTIKATYGDKSVTVPLAVSDMNVNLPINFANQVVPIFTKLGCNSGGCHGKASGQNGFKLSLLGFEPEIDYAALVMEARGRRVFPADPDNSLLLLKAVGTLPHGGGKRMEKDSDEYRLVRRWLAVGMPVGMPTDPTVTKVSVFPERRVIGQTNRQQLVAFAHYSDGSIEDITRRAQYESNDTEIASVDNDGLVRSYQTAGEAGVMIRYQGHVTVTRAVVPLSGKTPDYAFPPKTFVDTLTHKKWKELNLVPSELSTDEEFIRRAYVQICGTLPTPRELLDFVQDKDPNKRDRLIDTLLEKPEYAYYFAAKWADILRVKRRGQPDRARGTFAFHEWIREAMHQDKPYDEFVRDVLAATGDENSHPPTVWYKELQNPQQFVDDTAQIFLGLRIACAQCHHHPYEKWSQDDYWGMAAFFGRVGRKQILMPIGVVNNQATLTRVVVNRTGNVQNQRTKQPAAIKPLDAPVLDIPQGDDPRHKLVDWMADPNNPFFARAVVNRYWSHFFGRGLVDAPDDMRVTNPASNEELLDALAKDFIANKFSLKHLVRTIAKSRTYQLSAIPNAFNRYDKQNYARFYPQRMKAEVLLDAVNQVTDSPTAFAGMAQDAHAPKRAIMLPDDGFPSYFLEVFGKPPRTSACECERVSEANLAQALHMLNSDEVQQKIARAGARVDRLVKDNTRDDKSKVEELFLWAFGRPVKQAELDASLTNINKMRAKGQVEKAYQNIVWALLNAKEFGFVD